MKAWIQNIFIVMVILGLAGISIEMVSFRYWVTARQDLDALYETLEREPSSTIENHHMAGLPGSVQNWLQQTGVVGRQIVKTARSRQTFSFSTDGTERWRGGIIHHYVNAVAPGMVWMGTSKELPFVRLSGKKILLSTHEEETHPLLSMGRARVIKGESVRERLLIHYLTCLPWIPTAAVRGYLDWEGLPDQQARVTMTMDGVTVSGIFVFGEDGLPEAFLANIPVYMNPEFSYRQLMVRYDDYSSLKGVLISSQIRFYWSDGEEPVHWMTLMHTDIDYNVMTLWSSF